MKLKNIQIAIIVIGSIFVSLPFIARKVEQYNYVRQLNNIEEYVSKITGKGECTIEFKDNVIESDCAEPLTLSDHIMIERMRLKYENGIFEGEETLLVSSKKYPEQYCIGFSGLLVVIGDDRCDNLQNP